MPPDKCRKASRSGQDARHNAAPPASNIARIDDVGTPFISRLGNSRIVSDINNVRICVVSNDFLAIGARRFVSPRPHMQACHLAFAFLEMIL